MKAKRSVTRITSYKISKYDLARRILGDIGPATVSVDIDPGESDVTITFRTDTFGEETELED